MTSWCVGLFVGACQFGLMSSSCRQVGDRWVCEFVGVRFGNAGWGIGVRLSSGAATGAGVLVATLPRGVFRFWRHAGFVLIAFSEPVLAGFHVRGPALDSGVILVRVLITLSK